jgi:hypothetical protein
MDVRQILKQITAWIAVKSKDPERADRVMQEPFHEYKGGCDLEANFVQPGKKRRWRVLEILG